jgi:hypothetical protein
MESVSRSPPLRWPAGVESWIQFDRLAKLLAVSAQNDFDGLACVLIDSSGQFVRVCHQQVGDAMGLRGG